MKFNYKYAYVTWVKKMTFFVVVFTLLSIVALCQRGAAVTISGTVTLSGNTDQNWPLREMNLNPLLKQNPGY